MPNDTDALHHALYVAANPFLAQAGIYIDPDFVWQNIVQYLSDLKSAD